MDEELDASGLAVAAGLSVGEEVEWLGESIGFELLEEATGFELLEEASCPTTNAKPMRMPPKRPNATCLRGDSIVGSSVPSAFIPPPTIAAMMQAIPTERIGTFIEGLRLFRT